jgi:hypothetical protein
MKGQRSLLQRVIAEKQQLNDHAEHNDLDVYGPENYSDLNRLLNDMIRHLSAEEEKEHAA